MCQFISGNSVVELWVLSSDAFLAEPHRGIWMAQNRRKETTKKIKKKRQQCTHGFLAAPCDAVVRSTPWCLFPALSPREFPTRITIAISGVSIYGKLQRQPFSQHANHGWNTNLPILCPSGFEQLCDFDNQSFPQ